MKEVLLKPGNYTNLVKKYDKPIIVMAAVPAHIPKELYSHLLSTQDGIVHKDFATSAQALAACQTDTIFNRFFLCVYNLTNQEFVQHDKMPSSIEVQATRSIIAYYLNK